MFIACPFCGVAAGKWCRTEGGRRVHKPHAARVEPDREHPRSRHHTAEHRRRIGEAVMRANNAKLTWQSYRIR